MTREDAADTADSGALEAEDVVASAIADNHHGGPGLGEVGEPEMAEARDILDALTRTGFTLLPPVAGVEDVRRRIIEGLTETADDLAEFLRQGFADDPEHHARITESIAAYNGIADVLDKAYAPEDFDPAEVTEHRGKDL
jgi:hypothetical protein